MLANTLRKRREALGMTQAELAKALDVTPNTVARWERREMAIAHPGMVRSVLAMLAKERKEKKVETTDYSGWKIYVHVPEDALFGKDDLLEEVDVYQSLARYCELTDEALRERFPGADVETTISSGVSTRAYINAHGVEETPEGIQEAVEAVSDSVWEKHEWVVFES